MRVVALVSGGKDSCYNMMQCIAQGHEIVALANLKPSNADELDSYMYQTVGHHAIDLYSQAIGLPLYRREIHGQAVELGKNYNYNSKDEVEDLFELLKNILSEIKFEGVAVGAVLSDYQRVRVENVCSRLGLSCLAYLWRRDQKELLAEMISCHVDAIIIKVAAMGLHPQKHLGKNISEMYTQLCKLNKEFDCHMCGEGGEFETFTLDCPLFKKKIVVDSSVVVIHSDDAFAPVGYLNFQAMHLEDKDFVQEPNGLSPQILDELPLYRGDIPELSRKEEELEDNFVVNMSDLFLVENTTQLEKEEQISDVMTKCSDGFVWISGVKACSTADYIVDQADQAMKKLEKTLGEVGSSLQHVILVHIYVKSMLHYSAVNSVYLRYFDMNPPARVCVQTSFLDSTVLQLDCLAIKPGDSTNESLSSLKRDAMHVRSISHWAPANIGPYSQAVKVNEKTGFVAGCIGLWPSSMTLVDGGIDCEAPLALRHVQRILEAFIPGTTLSDVVNGVCYVTEPEFVHRAMGVWLNHCKKYPEEDYEQESVMQYVVVPALPKGALVEWHVVSHHCLVTRKCKQLSVDHPKGIKVSLAGLSCLRHMCGSINARIGVQLLTPRKLDVRIVEMLEYFLETLDSFSASCGLQWDILLLLRIFYRTDVFTETHGLRRAFRGLLEKEPCGKRPALVFVPVSKLTKQAEVLSLQEQDGLYYPILRSACSLNGTDGTSGHPHSLLLSSGDVNGGISKVKLELQYLSKNI